MQRNNFWMAMIFLHEINCSYCKNVDFHKKWFLWIDCKFKLKTEIRIRNSNILFILDEILCQSLINNPRTLFTLKYRWIGGHIEETSWKAFFKSRVDKFRTKLKFPASKWGWKEHSSLHGLFGLNILDDGKLIAQNFVF